MAIETYAIPEDVDDATWGNLLDNVESKPICRCLRYVKGAVRQRVRAHEACPNCKGFGFPPVPFEDLA